jgi:hypothetical protein
VFIPISVNSSGPLLQIYIQNLHLNKSEEAYYMSVPLSVVTRRLQIEEVSFFAQFLVGVMKGPHHVQAFQIDEVKTETNCLWESFLKPLHSSPISFSSKEEGWW